MRSFLINILSLLFLAVAGQGTTYYVSTTGSDAASGLSVDSAWQSIDNGDVTAVLVPGDTVNILPGTYTLTTSAVFSQPGTVASPIVYRGYGPGDAVFDAGGNNISVFDIGADYTWFQGMILRNSGDNGFEISGSNNLIMNCVVSRTASYGIYLVSGADNNRIYNNTLFATASIGVYPVSSVKTTRIINNIIDSTTTGIWAGTGNIAAHNNIWRVSNAYFGGIADSAGGISADPLFVDVAMDDFALQPGSPCIDSGMDLGYASLGTAPDIGALESTPSVPTNYYVSTTGDNANSGLDTANAWVSTDNGDSKGLVGPGDTINVLPGTYSVTSTILVSTNGTGLLPIVYRKWGNGEVVADLGGAVDEVFRIDASHTHLIGLTATNGGTHGFTLVGDSCVITECVVNDVGLQGIDVYGSDNLILRNLIFSTGESGLVNWAGAENNRYYNNTVDACPLDGVWIDASVTTARVFNNIVVAADEGIEGAAGNICGFNDVWNSATSDYVGGVSDSAGGMSADPKFQNPSGKDYNLKSTSPAIDTGLDLGYPFHGPAPDLGAMEVTGNQPPVLAAIGTQPTGENIALSFGVSATDAESTPTLTTSTLPTGAGFVDNGNGTGDFDWTPDFLQAGSYDVTFYATDDSLAIDSEVVTITVAEAGNRDPVLGAIGAQSTTENIALSFGVLAADIESTPTLTTSTLPTGAGFIDNGNGTGDFDWTPDFLQSGSYDITFYAADDSLAIDSEVVTITVDEAGNQLPALSPISDTVTTEWVNLTFDVKANDTESVPVLTTSTLPPGAGFVDNGDGTGDFDWTPTYPQAGIHPITFYAEDDSLAVDSVVVLITVDSTVTDYIVVSPDTATISTDSSLGFAANGFNSGGQQSRPGNVAWSLTVPLGDIDSSGLFEPHTPGTTQVIATSSLGLIDTSGTIEVVAGALAVLTVAPDSIEITSDSIATYTLTGVDADSNPTDLGSIAWSLTESIGTIDSAGVFFPTASGTSRVVATSSWGVTDTSQILIVNPGLLVRIEVTPNSDTLGHGDSVRFSVTGYDAVDSPTPTGPIDWAVMGGIGTIDTAGWLRATGSGVGYVVPFCSLYGLADTSGVVAVEALTVQAVPIGNSYLQPGDTAHAILTFTLSNGLSHDLEIEGLTLRDASRGVGTPPERLSNLDSIAVYQDIDGDAAVTAADARLAKSTMPDDTTYLGFAPLTIRAASSETFIVTVDASLYPRDGDSLDVYLIPETDIFMVDDSAVVVGEDSLNSSGFALVDGLVAEQLSLVTTGVYTAAPLGTASHVLTADLPRNGYRADTLTTLSVVNRGSSGSEDIDSLILYRDDGTGIWEGADAESRVSRLWYTGSQWTGSGLSEALTEQTTRFYVGAFLAPYPSNGATLALTIPVNGLEMRSFNDGPTDGSPAAIDTITIVTSEALVLQAVSLPARSLVPGVLSQPLTALDLTNSYATSAEIDSLKVTIYAGGDTGASQNQLDSQIDSLLLYLNRDNDHTEITSQDSLLASVPVVGGEVVFSTPGLALSGGGGVRELSIAALMNLQSSKNANSINVGLDDSAHVYLSSPKTVGGVFPLRNAAAHTIDIFPSEAIAVSIIESTTLYGAQTNQVVFDFELPRNGYSSDQLRYLAINNAGTVRSDEALSLCRLFADVSDDGFTGDDYPVGQFSFIGGQWVLSNLAYPLTDVSTRFLVVVDITSDQSAGGTLQFQIPVGGIEYGSGATGPDDLAVGNPETHLVFPSNRVTAISIPDVTRSVYPGSTENVLLAYALYNGYVGQARSLTSTSVTNLTRSSSGSAFADNELGQVSLYYDADKNRALDDDSLVASGYFSDGRLAFSGLNVALPPESLSYFFVVADIPVNSIDSDSLAVSIDAPSDFGFSEETIVNGDLPLAAGGFLVVDGSVTTQYELLGLVPRTLRPGDTSVTLFAFRPAINGDRTDTLESVSITNLLDATTSDIDPLEIWMDVDGDGVWQATDSLLAASVFSAGSWTAGVLGVEISEGNRPTIFAVGDVSATATPNAAFQAALPENGCLYASGNDGPIDAALEGANTFTVSNSGLRVSFPPLNETYSVGQTIEVRFTATNVQAVPMTDVSGMIVAISNPALVALVDSDTGPVSLEAGESSEFSFQYTALQPGEVSWQLRAVAPTFPDSSALIQTNTVSIQSAPSKVTAQLVNSIPTAVTRGQVNVFPMTIKFAHPDTTSESASLRLYSLRIAVEDGNENPLPANTAFSRLVLASGYSNLSIKDSVTADSSLLLIFSEPVIVAPGEERSLTLLVDIDSTATASNFALAVESASAIPIVDGNTLDPVTIDEGITWPLRTASCRLENPSDAGAVSYVPLLNSQVNYGQTDVPMLQLNLRHPGDSGSSQIQLTELSFMVVDDSGVAFAASDLFEDIRLLKQQAIIAMISGPQIETTALEMPLSSPLTLGAGQTDYVTILASIKSTSAVTGFSLLVSDSTQLVIRDVSSGFRLDAQTDNWATSTSAFPASSGFAQLREQATAPEVCIQSLLPGSIVGGVDSLALVEYRLEYKADANSSPLRLDHAGLVALDSASVPLDPTRLFDRLGYRLEGDSLKYQPFVEIINGATVIRFADSGLLVEPGDILVLELVADIEADVPYGDFLLQARLGGALSICDATDTTRKPGILSMYGCPTGLPFSTGVTEIYLAAGRPGVRAEESRILMTYPGQSGLNVLEGDLSYESESPQGDLRVGGIRGQVLRRTVSGLVPAQSAGLFSSATLVLDNSPVAVDTLLSGDSIVCRLDSEFDLRRGNILSLALACDIRPDAEPGNYVIRFADSTFFEVTDKNLSGAIYPTLSGVDYPIMSAELSVSAAGLEGSFTNYPNPFNPSLGEQTTIGYMLAEPAQVDIELFTITGEAVKNIVTDAYRSAGPHQSDTWSGYNDKAQDVVSGTYFCRITVRYASGRTETLRRKIAVVR